MLAVVALAITTLSATPPAAIAAEEDCVVSDQAMQVTANCIDPLYASPVIDDEGLKALPVPHYRVSGHFEDTNIEFNIYLHAPDEVDAWQGRFFQSTYPVTFSPDENTARISDRNLAFALGHGGYAVQTGNTSFALGYRHTAAAAKFAREVAADYYSSDAPIDGYLFGASGGSLQVVGAAENTFDVWQGFVPTVQAILQPGNYNFLIRSAAALILGEKAEEIRLSLLPGGSGDPFQGLDDAEAAMLREVHAMGVPWQAWEFPGYLLGTDPTQFPTPGFGTSSPLPADPSYVDDFWNTPGYLGTEESPLGQRVRQMLAELGDSSTTRWDIANRFYYRYQLPRAGEGWIAFDQFRDASGAPLYPQREAPIQIPTVAAGEAKFDGQINGKMIVLSHLYDNDALQWHTDWYRQRVNDAFGDAVDDHYRVYFNDHADHQGAPVPGDERSKYLVDDSGGLEQVLLRLAAWVEEGIEPPASTNYRVEDSQVVVPGNADERRGIQATVDLSVEGEDSATVAPNESVTLRGVVALPPAAGVIVSAAWDLEGDGTYTETAVAPGQTATAIETTATFTEPGTYFVALKVASSLEQDPSVPFAHVENLDRVRVIVVADECAQACAPILPAAVEVDGKPTVGETVGASTAPWDPSDVVLAYQWFADDEPIAQATAHTFTVTGAQLGKRLSVTVTGTKAGFEPVSESSPQTEKVVAADEGSAEGATPSDPDAVSDSALASTGSESPLEIVGFALILMMFGGLVLAVTARKRRSRG